MPRCGGGPPGQTTEQALAQLRAADIPAERVATIADVAVDPHLPAREMFAALPGTAGKPVLGAAMRFRSAASQPAAGAPALGEHAWRVLADIGVADGEAAALAAARRRGQAQAPAPRPKPAARPARLARIREES